MTRTKLYIVLLFLSISAFGCAALMQLNMFPVDKDIELGKQFDGEIRSNVKEYPILKNRPEIRAYITNIGNKILASPDIAYRNQFAYQFEVIDDDKTINAFCTPGGYVYIYTGLLKYLENEATLAGIIAHEIAHAERRHATNMITAQYGVQTVLEMASGHIGETGTQIAGVAAGLGFLKYSRTDEFEADAYSFLYLRSTEYYPGAICYFFQKSADGRQSSALETFFSTHPPASERLAKVNQMLADIGKPKPSEANLFTKRYQEFKKKLP
ncbi:MAG: M48 family metalloprotease [Bacteroidetes bacterium]|nr:M48 family metalloprotease [Bacteroidota bacterium]